VAARLDGHSFVKDWLADAQVMRKAAEGLYAIHRDGGPKSLASIDLALWLLADLWCDLLKLDCHPRDLPAGRDSLFPQFATIFLGHFVSPREGTPNRKASDDQTPAGRIHAICERWARAKKLEKQGLKRRRNSREKLTKHKD
jgi:hypothetical protein